MSNEHWQLLADIQQSLKHAADLPRGIFNGIAERLDEGVSGPSRAPLDALNSQLTSLLDQMLRLEPSVAQAIQRASSSSATEQAAYVIGQVSFAQLLAAQAAERRVNDDFQSHLVNSLYKPYIDALASKDLNGKELAQICGEVEETVSRKLKQLREFGITEFRREGTSFYNFLTPAARLIVAESNMLALAEGGDSTQKDAWIASISEKTQPHMRHSQSLSTLFRKAA